MRPTGDPQQAFAVIVGVEQCALFADDPLRGPVREAIAWFDWFRARGVPGARIAMFLSPKPASQPQVDDWRQRRDGAIEQPATQHAFAQFMRAELPAYAAGLQGATLFLAWSGHGLVDLRRADRTRRLFYADSAIPQSHNLELVTLMKALRSQALAGFAQQIAIVDACANYAIGLTADDALDPPTHFGQPQLDGTIAQQVLLAAAPGQLAQTLADGGADAAVFRFGHRLRDALGAPSPGAPTWPDFGAAFARVRAEFAAADLGADGQPQTPVDWCIGVPDDTLPDSGSVLLRDLATSRLLAALRTVDEATLAAAFRAVLADLPRTEAQDRAVAAGPAGMAALLAETAARPGQPPATVRWALQLRHRLGDSALLDRHPALAPWLQRADGDPEARRRYLESLRAPQARPTLCTVLIDDAIDRATGVPRLQAWLFAGEPPQALLLAGDPAAPDAAATLQALLDEALQQAQALGITQPDFVVEVALSEERLDEPIEARPVGPPGTPAELMHPLGADGLVVRRLSDRLSLLARRKEKTQMGAWRRAAELLRGRLRSGGLHIRWIDPAELRPQKLDQAYRAFDEHERGSCIGLAQQPASAALAPVLKMAFFHTGLPFACWSDADWHDADTARLEGDLADCTGPRALQRLLELRRADAAAGLHPGARLRILWDDPAHNPYDFQLGAAG